MVIASIMVTPYLDGMVNHAMIKNETACGNYYTTSSVWHMGTIKNSR